MKKLQRANEYFGVSETAYRKTGAFNPVIGVDSLFFVDSLLLENTKVPELKGGLKKVRSYFSNIITLLRSNNVAARKKAYSMLILREVRGVGIGYGSQTDDGSAIGKELAMRLMLTADELIKMGITDPAIFEVMGLFEEDFGPDRLSDAIIRILRPELLAYTERVTKELKVKTTGTVKTYERTYTVPQHPFKNTPVIFIPDDILRDLPVAHDYEQIADVAIFNKDLRERFNRIIAPCFAREKGKKRPTKREIKEYLLGAKERIGTLVEAYEKNKPDSYNFKNDPAGLYLWLEKARELVNETPLTLPAKPKQEDLQDIVVKIIGAFRKFIETKGGWRSLYDDKKKPLNESHARHFFYAVAMLYCEESDVDISPESNAGSGPVDFKLSRGHKDKIVVEVKLTTGNVRQGYEKQTRIYQESEEAKESYYVVIKVTGKSEVLEEILKKEEQEEKEGKKHPTIVVVDGREKLSASKTK